MTPNNLGHVCAGNQVSACEVRSTGKECKITRMSRNDSSD